MHAVRVNKLRYFAMTTVLAALVTPAAQAALPRTVEPSVIEKRFEQPKLPASSAALPTDAKPSQVTTQDGKKIFTLNSVKLENSSVYSAEKVNGFVQEFIGKEVSFAELQNIAQKLTAQYRNDGYILSRVILKPQKISGGAVTLVAEEGYINDIVVDGNLPSGLKTVDGYVDAIKAARPLNTKQLERYLLLLDDLPGITARSVVKPSASKPGASDLYVTLEEKKLEGSVSLDNYGSRYLGPYQYQGVLAVNSLFNSFDRTTFRGIGTYDVSELWFADVTHEEQIGTDGLRWLVRGAVARTAPGGDIDNLDIEGRSRVMETTLMYPVLRTREQNLFLTGNFYMNNSQNDVLDTKTYEDHVRRFTAGAAYDFTDRFGGVTLVDISATQGLDVLDATKDGAGRSRINGEHVFLRGNSSVTRIQELAGEWSLMASVAGQYSADPLLASEEFTLGGRNIGRAFDGGEIGGDHGLGGIIELRYGQASGKDWLDSYQFYSFYDLGAVWNKDVAVGDESKQTLASTGVGVRANFPNAISTDLQLSVPLTRDVASMNDEGDEPRIFFNLIKRF